MPKNSVFGSLPRLQVAWAFLLLLSSFTVGCASGTYLAAAHLSCDLRAHSTNIDSIHPRLQWELSSTTRGDRQTAFQILVASSPKILDRDHADLWDSGRVVSTSPVNAIYAGRPLKSLEQSYWKVRVWDKNGRISDWSKCAEWDMGLLRPADWEAKWIDTGTGNRGPEMPIFRREFKIVKPVRRAILSICGLGQFELHIDGKKIGNDVLQPGWTDYAKTCLYVSEDVTGNLSAGKHAVGVMLGNGMYNVVRTKGRYTKFVHSFGPPVLIAQINIQYTDGSSQRIGTDSTWKVAPGPIMFSSIYGGEDFDARKEQGGWDKPGFNDSSWKNAVETSGPGGKLSGASCSAPPIRVQQIFKPVKITQPKPRVWVYDLGQNCALIPEITVAGKPGQRVRIMPGEQLYPDGTVSQVSTRGPVWYTYTLRGGKQETWSPRFTYSGCRYLQITGVKPIAVTGEFISSTSPEVGQFACSNKLFNRTATLIKWAMRSNMMSILTDCPHRERLGWLEQDYLNGPSLMYNFDLSSLYEKIAHDMSEAQRPDDLVPDIAPEYTVFSDGFRDSPEWGSASILVPWQVYRWYGDEKILRDNYSMMQRYVAYMGTRAKAHILMHGLGDWYDIGPKPPGRSQLTPLGLTATATYYHDVTVLAKIALLLGHRDDAASLKSLQQQIRSAFNKTFYNPATHQYATGSQTANAMPIVFDLAPEKDRPAIIQNIVSDIRRRGNSLTAGDVGYRYLLEALVAGGRSDVIFDMNNQTTRPGYGYQLAHGATSLTEAWDTMHGSQDHFMLGHIMEWFYGDLAGIQPDPAGPGYRRIKIKSAIIGNLTWATASYHSNRGLISSSWRKNGNKLTLDVRIPPGTTATVYVPASPGALIFKSGRPADLSPGVQFLRREPGAAVYEIESGSYHFTSKNAPRE